MQMINRSIRAGSLTALLVLAGLLWPSAGRAELILSQLIVELQPGGTLRQDVEIWNDSPERTYVAVEPSEIVNAGLPNESRKQEPDPEKRGLLASPARMILEPGQRKLLRIAALAPAGGRERVYRVMVRPVAGEISSQVSGLKILVGYDVLVLLRPAEPKPHLVSSRTADRLNVRNEGNASIELVDGRQCDVRGDNCTELAGKRLYPGAEWTQRLSADGPVEYRVISGGRSERRTF